MAGQTQLTPGDGLYHSSSLSETVSPAFLRAAFSRSFFFFSLLLSVFLGCLICRAPKARVDLLHNQEPHGEWTAIVHAVQSARQGSERQQQSSLTLTVLPKASVISSSLFISNACAFLTASLWPVIATTPFATFQVSGQSADENSAVSHITDKNTFTAKHLRRPRAGR